MTILTSTNPSKNFDSLGFVNISTEQEVINAVKLAQEAKEYWGGLPLKQRVSLLKKLYDSLYDHKDDIGTLVTKEMGMPVSARDSADIDAGFDYFKWYLENVEQCLAPEVSYEDKVSKHTVYFEPTGVAAVIVPWNYPFCTGFAWSVVPNLLVGNTVVHKYSEECPLIGKFLADIVASSGLPEGIFTEIYGDGEVGDILVHEDIDLICFTGSTKVGQYLYKVAAEKFIKVILELGGSAPGIVFEDAELTGTLESIYQNRFSNSGQICDGLKRLLIQESKYKEVVAQLEELLKTKKVGDPEDPATDMGPLVAKRQQDLLSAQVKDAEDKGAKITVCGELSSGLVGAYFPPTIITDVSTQMRVWQEEVFGPVLPVVSFKTEEEAVKLANDTKYGLGSYIYTADKTRAARVAARIKSGMVAINSANYVVPQSPFGGYKQSGMGREHGVYGLRDLCQIKVVAADK